VTLSSLHTEDPHILCANVKNIPSTVSIFHPFVLPNSYIYHLRCIMFLSQYFSFPCQYHSTNAPYSFIHLPQTLYNVSLPVLQFPLSVSFHQCSSLIFIYMLLLPEGQRGEAWEPSTSNRKLESIGQRNTFTQSLKGWLGSK
jgi:hypothetical protein